MFKFILCLIISFSFIHSSWAGVVIINPKNKNPLDHISISKMFLGKTKTFANGSKCFPVDLKGKNPLAIAFRNALLKKSHSQLKAYWSKRIFTGKGKPPLQLISSEEVKQYVAQNIGAIGYIDESEVDQSVKVISTF